MKRMVAIIGVIALLTIYIQPANAQEGFLGGGVYTSSTGIMPTVRFGLDDTYLLDFGMNFSTVSTNNFAFILKGLGRFSEVDDVYIHGGALIEIAEIENTTTFQLGFLIGAEAPISNAFSVTADVVPLQITANGGTEAFFLQGEVGLNIYLH